MVHALRCSDKEILVDQGNSYEICESCNTGTVPSILYKDEFEEGYQNSVSRCWVMSSDHKVGHQVKKT